ncbi:alpha/beta hydrolase [Planctomonas sp. JC2975]|uniref:alpha/beta fold hydrolase n=1 Tax=Planctomonas sp. JC2975 TaxID=2729626 RepID=UPI0014731F23|nr:alpha/beta hydrolase [Planctomonas sp. JC2975]NNC10481.1 alpha/beta hydrolase [Planctomonas sp. JC2975]
MSARPTPTASSARQPAPREPSPRTLEVDGSTTAYWDYGAADAATTLVLVHGFRGDHHGLQPIAERLTEFRVIVPDLPGFGASDPLSERVHDIDGYAAWLSAFIADVRPTGRFVLLGHSFGSIVVSAMLGRADSAASVPESPRPDLVVLVNPIGAPALKGPRAIFTRLAIFYYWLAAALPESLGFGLLRNRAIVRVMSEAMAKTKDRRLRAWIHGQHAQYFSAFANRAVVLEAFKASVGHDVSEYASSITEPVLLIAADRDDITPIAAQRRLQTLFPDASLHVVNGVGHLVHYEAPEEAADQVRAFVIEHGTDA